MLYTFEFIVVCVCVCLVCLSIVCVCVCACGLSFHVVLCLDCCGGTVLYVCIEHYILVNMYHVSAQGVDEYMINVDY